MIKILLTKNYKALTGENKELKDRLKALTEPKTTTIENLRMKLHAYTKTVMYLRDKLKKMELNTNSAKKIAGKRPKVRVK